MKTPSIAVSVIGAGLMFAATAGADPYNPAERAIGGGLVGAGTGAVIGAIAGGGRGAAVGAAVGGGVGAAVGAATTPPPPHRRSHRHTARHYY
jgi:hypothetical protein